MADSNQSAIVVSPTVGVTPIISNLVSMYLVKMEEIYVDEVLERGREFEDDRYVRGMKRIYDQAVSVLPDASVITMIYAYTIARLLYPGQKWRIMSNNNDLFLRGRDMVVVGEGDIDSNNGTPACGPKSIIAIAESQLSPLITPIIDREGLMTPELEEDLMYGGTHLIYTPLSNFPRVFQDHPAIEKRLRYIIEQGDPTMILKLDAGGMKYLLYLDVLLYQFYNELVSIFNRIPPAGCGTGLRYKK